MSLETKTNLDESTVSGIQKLIRYNIDSANGFREAAEDIETDSIASLFRDLAVERKDLAAELQTHVQFNGENPVDSGSAMAAVHRAWINVRGMLNGGAAHPILCEAEKGEDYIKAAYEDVLKDTAGSAMNDVLTQQYAKVKAGHDRVRDLRDTVKAS
ncbi:PA2169 family four-helix-bundle protein [Mariniblastus fucicola]|uniref:DUF2383 domain-containing protein n=1 Tax=Mariniblastus fucicola TaxID=980251 RepID=A0A5B9PJG7_9BACT|nr:PA2169 family four-helix-bundle protein [Mariniblastus fucicola]QEG24852.1 hypothetical protein MFFC18_47750 [Mariniblastus fucicola]